MAPQRQAKGKLFGCWFFPRQTKSSTQICIPDARFQPLKDQFQAFACAFVQSVDGCLSTLNQAHLSVFQEFQEKYGPVAAACEKWQVASSSEAFGSGYQATAASLEQVVAAQANVKPSMAALATFCSHGSGSDSSQFQEVLGKAKETHKNGMLLMKEAKRIGAIVVVAGVILKDNAAPEDAKATLDFAIKEFDLVKEALPAKMLKLVTDLIKATGISDEIPDQSDAQGQGGRKNKVRASSQAEGNTEEEANVSKRARKEKKHDKDKEKKKEKKDKKEKSDKADKADKVEPEKAGKKPRSSSPKPVQKAKKAKKQQDDLD